MRITTILILSAFAAYAQEPKSTSPERPTLPEAVPIKQLSDIRPYVVAQVKGNTNTYVYGAPAPGLAYKLSVSMSERWWRNAQTAQTLGFTAEQMRKMDEIFQQHRLRLIDLNAALEKEEVTLEPLVADETLDDTKITAQIDRVAQARAELEKANGRMLLGIRKVLTPDQWRKLNLTRVK
jgi:Spy/CpxP family protein refolding chaperone